MWRGKFESQLLIQSLMILVLDCTSVLSFASLWRAASGTHESVSQLTLCPFISAHGSKLAIVRDRAECCDRDSLALIRYVHQPTFRIVFDARSLLIPPPHARLHS